MEPVSSWVKAIINEWIGFRTHHERQKAAKKLIKRAKQHPDWYTKQEAWYAKMIKKNESKISNSNTRRREDDGLHSKSEQSKESKQIQPWMVYWVIA